MKTLIHLEFFQMFINIQKSLFFEIVLCVCRFVTNVCPKQLEVFKIFKIQESFVLCWNSIVCLLSDKKCYPKQLDVFKVLHIQESFFVKIVMCVCRLITNAYSKQLEVFKIFHKFNSSSLMNLYCVFAV